MMYEELIKTLRNCVRKEDNEWNCAVCEYENALDCFSVVRQEAADAIENLVMQLNKTGVFTEDGTEILKGDKVTGLFLYSESITGTVIFKDGSFGVEWDRGGSMEFTPFTSTCNVKWEVVQE